MKSEKKVIDKHINKIRNMRLRIISILNKIQKKGMLLFLKSNKDLLATIHKTPTLIFQSIGGLPKITRTLYKSASGSEYWIGVLKNSIVYIRKSNHWGKFSTCSKPVEGEGVLEYNWILENPDERKVKNRFYQFGYIVLHRF